MKVKILIMFLVGCLLLNSCGKSGRRRRTEQKELSSHRTSNQARENVRMSSSNKVLSGKEIFHKYNSAVFMIITSDGTHSFQGSGFFISSSGLAVSNYHVFKGTYIGLEQIRLSTGEVLNVAKVVAQSNDKDYIVFRVENNKHKKFDYIPISSRPVEVGDRVYAIGSPRGLENTFSSGEVSQKRENNIIQISVPIDHGSSGGALINTYGEVIGITSGGRDDSGANLNYAIDIKVVKDEL